MARDVKTCSRCGLAKPLDDFARDRKKPDGRWSICKVCKRADDKRRREDPVKGPRLRQGDREWARNNPERMRAIRRRGSLKRRYGISARRYAEMLADQDGKCAICGSPDPMGGHPEWGDTFCVDHDHDTGVIRGLLCHRCNRGLGQFNDDPLLIREALAYLSDTERPSRSSRYRGAVPA